MARARREGRNQVDIWPGFVDALSTLILSIIFLLVVFVLAQFFLGQLLQGRTEAVQRLEGQIEDLTSQLGLEQDEAAELRRTMGRINADLQQAFLDRDELSADLGESEAARAQLGEQMAVMTRDQALDAAHAGRDAAVHRSGAGPPGRARSRADGDAPDGARPTRRRSSCSSAS